MNTTPSAASMIATRLTRERDHLVQEAANLAHMAGRLAEDVGRGIAIGAVSEIADAARRLESRALTVRTLQDTAELYAADLIPEPTP